MTTTEGNEIHTPSADRPASRGTLVYPPGRSNQDFIGSQAFGTFHDQHSDENIGLGLATPAQFRPKNGNVYTRFPLTARQAQDQDTTLYAVNSRKFQEAWRTLNETEGVPDYMKTPQAEEMLKHVVTVNPASIVLGMTAQQLANHGYLKMLNPNFQLPPNHPYAGRRNRQTVGMPNQFAGLTASPYAVGTTALQPTLHTPRQVSMGDHTTSDRVKVERGAQGNRATRRRRSQAELTIDDAVGFISDADLAQHLTQSSGDAGHDDKAMDEAPPVRQSSVRSKHKIAQMIGEEESSSEEEEDVDLDADYGMIH